MLTRVAESIYLINRYVERAENTARFVDVTFNSLLDFPVSNDQQWQSLIRLSGDENLFQERYEQITPESAIEFVVFDHNNSRSLVSCLQTAREKARTIRQFISEAVWQQVNRFALMVEDTHSEQISGQLFQFLREIQSASYLFIGAMHETMAHEEGWHFGKMGRLLERIDQVSHCLLVHPPNVLSSNATNVSQELSQMALLKAVGAYEMYRKRYHRLSAQEVAEFVILDRIFPRSLRFCLGETEDSLHSVTKMLTGIDGNQVECSLKNLCSQLDGVAIAQILPSLPEFLSDTRQQTKAVAQEVNDTFFTLASAT